MINEMEIRKAVENDGIFRITYKGGSSRAAFDLRGILPASAGDMKRICSFLDLSDDPETYGKIIYDYIAVKVADLKETRRGLDENRADDREMIGSINADMKKYLANAAALVKRYNLPEMTDADAQTVLKAATVYGVGMENGQRVIKEHAGFTFEKSGYRFDVYKEGERRSARYLILVNGTGLQICEARKKNAVTAEITPKIIEWLTKNAKKIDAAKKEFNKLMTAAGIQPEKKEDAAPVQAERHENILNDFMNGGKNMIVTFKKNELTLARYLGAPSSTSECEYNILEDETVLVFAIVGKKEDGRKEKQRIKIAPGSAHHKEALAAAKDAAGIQPEKKRSKPAPVKAEKIQPEKKEDAAPVQAEKPAAKKEDAAPARDPKQARGPVPEKTFIGETIQGNGWKILFDGATERTRVMFTEKPTDTARAAVENAGFYYSPKMDSWNKKLTFKAYRAAKKLSGELEKIYAA